MWPPFLFLYCSDIQLNLNSKDLIPRILFKICIISDLNRWDRE